MSWITLWPPRLHMLCSWQRGTSMTFLSSTAGSLLVLCMITSSVAGSRKPRNLAVICSRQTSQEHWKRPERGAQMTSFCLPPRPNAQRPRWPHQPAAMVEDLNPTPLLSSGPFAGHAPGRATSGGANPIPVVMDFPTMDHLPTPGTPLKQITEKWPPPLPSPTSQVGGCLSSFSSMWHHNGASPCILSTF